MIGSINQDTIEHADGRLEQSLGLGTVIGAGRFDQRDGLRQGTPVARQHTFSQVPLRLFCHGRETSAASGKDKSACGPWRQG